MFSYGPPHMAVQKQDDQHEHSFSNYVRIRDVVQKTCLRRWTIGKSGERGSGISVLPARHDDDDDDSSRYLQWRSSMLEYSVAGYRRQVFLLYWPCALCGRLPKRVRKNSSLEEDGINALCSLIGQCPNRLEGALIRKRK